MVALKWFVFEWSIVGDRIVIWVVGVIEKIMSKRVYFCFLKFKNRLDYFVVKELLYLDIVI